MDLIKHASRKQTFKHGALVPVSSPMDRRHRPVRRRIRNEVRQGVERRHSQLGYRARFRTRYGRHVCPVTYIAAGSSTASETNVTCRTRTRLSATRAQI
jgi:hypothetical protein